MATLLSLMIPITTSLFIAGVALLLLTSIQRKLKFDGVLSTSSDTMISSPSFKWNVASRSPINKGQHLSGVPTSSRKLDTGLLLEQQEALKKYEQEVAVLQKREAELTEQRNQLAIVLQHMQSKHVLLLEENKRAALSQLKDGLAHELNNALNVVGGVIGPLCQDFEELKQNHQATWPDDVMEEMDLLLKALADSSDRAKVSATNFIEMIAEPEVEENTTCDLHDLFNTQFDWLKISYPEITFEFKVEKGLKVFGDYSGLLLAVNNLLINAVEASHRQPNPKIDMSITQSKGQLALVVRDNGIGVPNEIKHKIFEPFYTTKDNKDTAGLGLFALHGLVNRLKGSIEVRDNLEAGGGTIFRVTIPMGYPLPTDSPGENRRPDEEMAKKNFIEKKKNNLYRSK